MKKTVFVINGPNLNMLGLRQPEIYGSVSLEDVEKDCISLGKSLNLHVQCFQSNNEWEIIEFIHKGFREAHGIIINAGAYSHTSIALLDALNLFIGAVIEVHISNIYQRERFRHFSYISERADGLIIGCGVQGYRLALHRLQEVFTEADRKQRTASHTT